MPILATILFLLYAGFFGFDSYGMYSLLRIWVCVIAVVFAFAFYSKQENYAAYIFGIIAVLFNPIIKIHFNRSTWQSIDIVVALIFACAIIYEKKNTLSINKKADLPNTNLDTKTTNFLDFAVNNKNKELNDIVNSLKKELEYKTQNLEKLEQQSTPIIKELENKIAALSKQLAEKDTELKDAKDFMHIIQKKEREEANAFIKYHLKNILTFNVLDIHNLALSKYEYNKYSAVVGYDVISEDIWVSHHEGTVYTSYASSIEIYAIYSDNLSPQPPDSNYFQKTEQSLRDKLNYIYPHTRNYLRSERLSKYQRK